MNRLLRTTDSPLLTCTLTLLAYGCYLSLLHSFQLPLDQVHFLWALELVFFAGLCLVVILVWQSSRAPWREKMGWLVYLAFSLSGSYTVWKQDLGFMRLLAELYLLSVLILLGTSRRLARVALISSIVLWVVAAANLVSYY